MGWFDDLKNKLLGKKATPTPAAKKPVLNTYKPTFNGKPVATQAQKAPQQPWLSAPAPKPKAVVTPAMKAPQQPWLNQPAAPAQALNYSYGGGTAAGVPTYGGGDFSVGTGGNAGYYNPGPVAPAPPPPKTYSMDDSDETIADVDSTFRDQKSAYLEAVKKFQADIVRRKGDMTRDADKSIETIGKNRVLGLTGINEDYAARGLGYSGLQVDAYKKGNEAYKNQNDSVVRSHTTGQAELDFSKNKEDADTLSRIQAAKRDALYRLQLNNNLT